MLDKKQYIDSYIITFPIKEGAYAETYRVKDGDGKNYFLKLINCSKLNRKQFDGEGSVLEVEIAKQLNHKNLTTYHDSGEVIIDGKKCVYIVFDLISGETVADKVNREQFCSVYDAKQIIVGVLNGLKFLYSLPRPIIHNELTIQNIMLDMSSGMPMSRIIDFGYARFDDQGISYYDRKGLSPFYIAPEAMNGVFSIQSDLYAVGTMLYQLIYGKLPYYIDLSQFENSTEAEDALDEMRQKPLMIPEVDVFELDENLQNIMSKALAYNVEDRFKSVDDFIKALHGEIKVDSVVPKKLKFGDAEDERTNITRKVGNGFKDVAGMNELKEQLQSDVIDLIQNPEKAKELGLSLPNGLLFYGPPGCGKTFFAEKFAEETGFNYKYIKCSDVASPFIHGGQGKIAAIFDDARKNSPTILFFDEIDAMIKDRSKHNNVSESGEVNEFLTQLNNCGETGVLVIGATNKPNEIDEAALRSGRLEFKYYIPLPDVETRASIFEINLSKRKCDFGIDFEKLAAMTENYISADIKMIVDNAARLTFRRKQEKILQSTLEEVIAESKPSISIDVIKRHETIRDEFMGTNKNEKRRKIGFTN